MLSALYLRTVNVLAGLAGVILALTAILIPVNLVLRTFFGTSIFGLLDAVEYGLMIATFLAAPWVLMHNAHVTVDIATLMLPEAPRQRLAVAINVIGALLSLTLGWYALRAAMISFERGSVIRTAFNVPEWLTLTIPVIAGVLLAIEFIRRCRQAPDRERSRAGL